jgi:hypothetical protein
MMRTFRPGLALVGAVASIVFVAACGDEDAPGGGTTPDVTTSAETSSPEPSTTLPLPGPAPTSAVDQSIALLADQLGISPDEIEVARAIEIDWRDGSIGCAKKGQGYTQVITPGALVELSVDGTLYAFHQAQNMPPFYCANPTEPLDDQ